VKIGLNVNVDESKGVNEEHGIDTYAFTGDQLAVNRHCSIRLQRQPFISEEGTQTTTFMLRTSR
jgi:hypothetical protein